MRRVPWIKVNNIFDLQRMFAPCMPQYFHDSIHENAAPRINHFEENEAKYPYDDYDYGCGYYAAQLWDDGPLPKKVVSISSCDPVTFDICMFHHFLRNLAHFCHLMCFETFISGYFSEEQLAWAMDALSGSAASAFCPSTLTATPKMSLKKKIRCT